LQELLASLTNLNASINCIIIVTIYSKRTTRYFTEKARKEKKLLKPHRQHSFIEILISQERPESADFTPQFIMHIKHRQVG
jgi:hypothetical protein